MPQPDEGQLLTVTLTGPAEALAAVNELVSRCIRLLDRCDQLTATRAELIEIAEVRRYLKGAA